MVKRRLNNSHQCRAKRETKNHRDTQRESYLYDGPSKVFQMLEKRLGRFGLRRITKFENVSQRHGTEKVNAARAIKGRERRAEHKRQAGLPREFHCPQSCGESLRWRIRGNQESIRLHPVP